MLVSSWTVFYGQKVSNNDSTVCLTLNQANYFINQNTKAEYFEKDNIELLKKDSLNSQELANSKDIIHINDSIINIQRQFIKKEDRILDVSKNEIIKGNRKIKVRNILLGYSVVVIIIETILLGLVF